MLILTMYVPLLVQRLRDNNGMVFYLVSQNVEYYTMFKCDFNYEIYLDCISNNVKRCFSQFRISSHHLEIALGKYNNISRNERKWKLCNCNMVESEYHFLLYCRMYNDLRRKYNIRCNWPNLTRFKNLLLSQNVKVINAIYF